MTCTGCGAPIAAVRLLSPRNGRMWCADCLRHHGFASAVQKELRQIEQGKALRDLPASVRSATLTAEDNQPSLWSAK